MFDVPVSAIAAVGPEARIPTGLTGKDAVSFIPMSDVSESGHWAFRQARQLRTVIAGFTAFEDGDVLVAKITPCLENGKGAHAVGLQGGIGFGSTEFHVLRAKPGIAPRFVFHLTQWRRFRRAAEGKMVGSAGQQRVPRSFFDEFLVVRFGFAEQAAIARVLDTLDTAIRETEAIIAKLKAFKQGLLHDLLSRGIDANGELRPPQAEAPDLYKESSLGWIPREWTFGALLTWLMGKPRNGYSPQEAGEWTGIQMLGLGCLTTEGFEPVQLKSAPRGDRSLAMALLTDGDLLMSRSNTRDLVGLAGVYRDVGTPCTYPDLMMRLRPCAETSGEFLQFVLRSPGLRRQIQAHAVGTSGSMVKISGRIVCELATAMPRKPEQERILSCLAGADSRLGAEVDRASLLRDIRSGLMDDLLTGRVRVTPLLQEGAAP